MAEESGITIRYSRQALSDLDQIWTWNAEKYGLAHADAYLQFLREKTQQLIGLNLSRHVPSRPSMRYVVIRKHRRGHGHIAVFEELATTKTVLHFFHTSQNWEASLT